MKFNKTLGLFCGILTSSMMISSCGTDPAIKSAQDFGLMSAEFETNTDKLADDLYNSCIRRISYFAVREGTEARDEALVNCENLNKPAVGQAKNANKIITDYVKSIGQLAADDLVKFDDEFNQIKDSLNNFSIATLSGNITFINSDQETNSLNTPLTLEELVQVREIALNYHQEIEPLLKQMEEGLKEK
jgi:hypothetical protein